MRDAKGILGHWLIACCTWSRLSRQSYNACCCARCRGVSFRSRWTCWRGCAGIYELLCSLGDYLLSNKILLTSELVPFLKISVTRLRKKQKIAQLVSLFIRRFFSVEKRQLLSSRYNLARAKRIQHTLLSNKHFEFLYCVFYRLQKHLWSIKLSEEKF